MSFNELLQRRLILLTGKGGVGKTTLAASLAMAAERRQKRVALCEIGGPSQLAPLFGAAEVEHEPRSVRDGIALSVLSPERGIRAYLSERIRIPGVVDLVFKQPAVAKFFRAAPAFSEMGALYAIVRLLERGGWDHVIVDLPASGHALGMLEAPFEGKRIFRGGPVRALCESVEQVLLDARTTATAVVTLAEELPATEAADLAENLRSRGFPVGAVVVNARQRAPLEGEESAALARFEAEDEFRPLAEAARTASARAARGAAIVEKLAARLGETPLSLSFHPENGMRLLGLLADEMEAQMLPPNENLTATNVRFERS